MVSKTYSCQYGKDITPPILSVVSIYPNGVVGTEAVAIH